MIKRLSCGSWFVDVEPVRNVRFRRKFKTKAEAIRFEAEKRFEYSTGRKVVAVEKRQLSDLVNDWFSLHGQTLSDGERRRNILLTMCTVLNDPLAMDLSPTDFNYYRMNQLHKGVAGKTLNNRLGYLRAVYNELIRLGNFEHENPLVHVKPLKLQEQALTYLSSEEIKTLFQALKAYCQSEQVALITKVCLATGARWGEAQGLRPSLVKNRLVTFVNTKSKKSRSIPISKSLEGELHDHFNTHGLFTNCSTSFARAVERSSIKLPPGQCTHILRHTFASHFVMNGGNILVLQKILGHSSLAMTMKYAHLAPDHLTEALRLNPLVKPNKTDKKPTL